MNDNKRTPGPYTFIEHACGDYAGHIKGRDENCPDDTSKFRSVATVAARGGKTLGIATGKFIVQACNNFDSLLAACKKLAELFPEDNMDSMDAADFTDRAFETMQAVEAAKKAISKIF